MRDVSREDFLLAIATKVVKSSGVSPHSVDTLARVSPFGSIEPLRSIEVIAEVGSNSTGDVSGSKVQRNRSRATLGEQSQMLNVGEHSWFVVFPAVFKPIFSSQPNPKMILAHPGNDQVKIFSESN